jgi:hypothetical protein
MHRSTIATKLANTRRQDQALGSALHVEWAHSDPYNDLPPYGASKHPTHAELVVLIVPSDKRSLYHAREQRLYTLKQKVTSAAGRRQYSLDVQDGASARSHPAANPMPSNSSWQPFVVGWG